MIKKILLAAAIFSLSNSILAGDFETAYIQNFTTFYPQLQKNAKNIWPGWTIDNNPTLLYFHSGHSYAFNFNPTNPDWQKLSAGDLTYYFLPQDEYLFSTFQPSLAKPFFSVDGQNAMINSPMQFSEDPEPNILFNDELVSGLNYAYYEIFYSPYKNSKLDLLKKHIVYTGFNDQNNLGLYLLGNQALNDYLTSGNLDYLKDFAAISQIRLQNLDVSTINYETRQDVLFNNYISFKAASKNDEEYIKNVMNDAPPTIDQLHISFLDTDNYDNNVQFQGEALSFGLDKIDSQWKNKVEMQNISPLSILIQDFNFSTDEIAQRFANAQNRYDYADIQNKLANLLGSQKGLLQALLEAYSQNKDPEIVILHNSDQEWEYQFSMNSKEYFLDSDSIIDTNLANYKNLSTGQTISCDNLPVFMTKNIYASEFDKYTQLSFKIPAESTVTIDGIAMPLSEFVSKDKDLVVHQISISGPNEQYVVVGNNNTFKINVASGKLTINAIKGSAKTTIGDYLATKAKHRIKQLS